MKLDLCTENRPFSILVCGPALSGRSTILQQIVKLSEGGGSTLGNAQLPPSSALIRWRTRDRAFDVKLAMARALSNFRFEGADKVQQKPWAKAELDLLGACDGLLVVLDLQIEMYHSNLSFLGQLDRWLSWCGRKPESIPTVYFLNKAELFNSRSAASAVQEMKLKSHYFSGVALDGSGVRPAVDQLAYLISKN